MVYFRVREVIDKAERHNLEVLTEGNLFYSVRVERTVTPPILRTIESLESGSSAYKVTPDTTAVIKPIPISKKKTLYEIRSPLIGTFFWHMSKINRPLKSGRVKEGQALGVIYDVYDNFWEIKSPYTGKLISTHVINEYEVNEGDLLFKINVKN